MTHKDVQLTSESGALTHHTPTTLRMRIAETRVRQWRIAQRVGVSEVHLSHVLVGRRSADDDFLTKVAGAIDEEVAEAASA